MYCAVLLWSSLSAVFGRFHHCCKIFTRGSTTWPCIARTNYTYELWRRTVRTQAGTSSRQVNVGSSDSGFRLRVAQKLYTVFQKVSCLIITLANVDRFQNSFTGLFVRKVSMCTSQRFPPHLQYVATLPCVSWKSTNVTDFDSTITLLTCSRGHFADTWFNI